jgi:hypothetical protein
MKRPLIVLVSAAAVVALAACGPLNVIIVNPPSNAVPVTANSDSSTPLDTVSLAPGESRAYEISVPSSVRSQDVLYVEASAAVNLTLFDGDGFALASSSTPSVFARGKLGLSALGTSMDTQSVDVAYSCLGSCAIWRSSLPKFYAVVENTGGSTRSVDVYAYGAPFHDTGETANDSTAGATSLYAGTDEQGALELLGDVDFWDPDGSHGYVTFDAVNTPVDMVAEIVYDTGARVSGTVLHYPGDPAFDVYSGEYLKIYANNSYAGASSKSTYYLSYATAP